MCYLPATLVAKDNCPLAMFEMENGGVILLLLYYTRGGPVLAWAYVWM